MEYIGKVTGTPVSKSNSYRIITINGHASLTKTKAMKEYEEKFLWQVGAIRDANINVPFEFHIDVYFPSKRSDLDGMLKGVMDCLQKANVIKNDNNCCLIHARKFIDKDNPRIEFKIITID
jgi:Holliday junction resolvase RusA-like endonuclease